MKSLIIQFNIDISLYDAAGKSSKVQKTENFIESYSKKSFELYCHKYNHDYIRIQEPRVNYSHPTWERIDLWLNPSWCNEYDLICYVDTDIFALPWAEDIMQYCNLEAFNFVPQPWKALRLIKNNKYTSLGFSEFTKDYFKKHWFQPGVFVISKKARNAMLDIVKKFRDEKFSDDGILLNYALMKSCCQKCKLPYGFNVKWWNSPFPTGISETSPTNINFLHASGSRKRSPNIQEQLHQLLKRIYGKQ